MIFYTVKTPSHSGCYAWRRKRTYSFMMGGLALALLLALAGHAFADPQLSLTPCGATLGSTVTVELRASGATEAYLGVNAKISLPPGVTVQDVQPGDLLSSSFSTEWHVVTDGIGTALTFLTYTLTESMPAADGALAVITLKVSDDPVVVGLGTEASIERPLVFSKSGIAAYDGETSLPHTTVNGVMYISVAALPRLSVDPVSANVPSALTDAAVNVSNIGMTAGMAWTATVVSGADWLTMNQAGGMDNGPASFRAAANPKDVPRSGSIRIDAGNVPGSPVLISVQQAADNTPILSVDPAELALVPVSGLAKLNIQNTGNGIMHWTAQVVQGVDWLTAGAGAEGTGNGAVTLTFTTNTTPTPRVGLVVVEAPGALNGRVVVACTQRPPAVMRVLPQSRAVGPTAGTVGYDVTNAGGTPLDWTATIVSGTEWATIASGAAGHDNGTITVSYQANAAAGARTATVRVESPGVIGSPFDVTLVQAGNSTPLLSVTPLEKTVEAAGGSCEFAVANAGNGSMLWKAEVQTGGDWLNVASGAGGENTGAVKLTVLPNRGVNKRVGTVQISAAGADNSPVVVTVTQKNFEPITVVSPNGGENLRRNTPFTLTWTSSSTTKGAKAVNAVAINLWRGGNLKRVIVSTVDNSGTHEWVVPADLEPANDYQIQIVNAADTTVNDVSDGMFAIACPPETPPDLMATDGEEGPVRVLWSQVDSATSYEVYRSETENYADARLIGTTSVAVFEDDTADKPHRSHVLSCTMITKPYWYWVRSVNGCEQSPVGTPDQGSRGKDKLEVNITWAAVLPNDPATADTLAAHRNSELAIRLRDDRGIKPESVMGWIEWEGNRVVTTSWVGIDETDGWVVYKPTASWPVGVRVTFTVTAQTSGGEPVGSVTFQFTVVGDDVMPAAKEAEYLWQPDYSDFDASGMDLTAESNEGVGVRAEDESLMPELANGIGMAFEIGPAVPFETPHRVWLPLPEGLAADSATLYYYQQDLEEMGWYSADRVANWVLPDSYLVIETRGIKYLGFLVNHGGMVRLGNPATVTKPVKASVVPPVRGIDGDYIILLVGALSLMAARLRNSPRAQVPGNRVGGHGSGTGSRL